MKQFTCVFLTIILLLTLAACQKAPEVEPVDEALDWQTQYDLGVRYLSEGNYEEAILAFEAAIEIDPRNADAYLKLAQVCEQREDYAKTLQTLEAGLEQTDDQPAGVHMAGQGQPAGKAGRDRGNCAQWHGGGSGL